MVRSRGVRCERGEVKSGADQKAGMQLGRRASDLECATRPALSQRSSGAPAAQPAGPRAVTGPLIPQLEFSDRMCQAPMSNEYQPLRAAPGTNGPPFAQYR